MFLSFTQLVFSYPARLRFDLLYFQICTIYKNLLQKYLIESSALRFTISQEVSILEGEGHQILEGYHFQETPEVHIEELLGGLMELVPLEEIETVRSLAWRGGVLSPAATLFCQVPVIK